MHPLVKAEYDKHEFPYTETTEDQRHADFLQKTKGSTHKLRINTIYRVRLMNQKEYLYYHYTIFGESISGNEHTDSQIAGKYEFPIFHKNFDNATNKLISTYIDRKETRYDIEFSPKNLQDILRKGEIEYPTAFVIDNGARKYGGFSYDDFKDATFDQLLAAGRKGDVEHVIPIPMPVSSVITEEIKKESKK